MKHNITQAFEAIYDAQFKMNDKARTDFLNSIINIADDIKNGRTDGQSEGVVMLDVVYSLCNTLDMFTDDEHLSMYEE